MAAQEKNTQEIEKAKKLHHVPWCEEYEKMISGMLYNSFTPPLNAARFKARAFANKYNTWFPDPETTDTEKGFDILAAERLQMLKQVIGHVADDKIFIEPPFNIDYGCNISLGKRFYSNFNLTILDCSLVTIGDRCMFGPNVSIFAATHETEVQSRRDNIEYGRPGVKIGKGVTVGAMSVVTKDVPDFCVVMGQPARVVKRVAEVPMGENGAVASR